VAAVLSRGETTLNAREAYRLAVYLLLRSPRPRLKLLWRHIWDQDTPVRRRYIEHLAQELRAAVGPGARVMANFFERRNYSRDLARVPPFLETLIHRTTPYLVVQPSNEADIVSVLAFCRSKGLALYPRGSGSFAFGGAVPTRNGVVLDLSPMMAVLAVDPEARTVRVQPGARWSDVAAALEPFGLTPVTTPTSRFSTAAGWISTGGLGLHSHAYGHVAESIVGARVVRPDGTVEELDAADDSLRDLFGTEGQFGILTEIILRTRPTPGYSGPCLIGFEAASPAFAAFADIISRETGASHAAFFDRNSMIRENVLFREQTGYREAPFPEKDTILIHFESRGAEDAFLSSFNGSSESVRASRLPARCLWSERYFPLKAQRIGPGLLGSEVVIPLEKLEKYSARVRRLGRRFGLLPALEVIAGRRPPTEGCLVIVSFACDHARTLHYILCLLFIQLLVKAAVDQGGRPYGIGIWNTPFVQSRYGRTRLKELEAKKQALDPDGILNPGKFFRVKGRFFGIPALALRPLPFRMIMSTSHMLLPVLGLISRMARPPVSSSWDVPSRTEQGGESLIRQSSQRCTSCGSCVSVCPAYHITRDELVTGRSKLRMADAMLSGLELEPDSAYAPFQCLHCGLCEEVCQTHLPLRECYLVLEDWIEERYGPAADTVRAFVERLDADREYIKEVFGLDIPEWAPESPPAHVPRVERPGPEGERD
jgi:FAD/FMN-containing dehydrogenase/ferredoxin